MAGIRQHIIPRFLLKGFASKTVGKEVFTWVFRAEGKRFESNIINVGVEKYFYGKDGDDTVDDEITDIEREFAILLDKLRAYDHGMKIVSPKIAEFICHLAIRTKHLRDSLIESTSGLANTLTTYLADAENFRFWIFEYYKRHPEVLRNAVEDVLKQIKIPKHQKPILRQYLMTMIRPDKIVDQMQNDIPQYASMFGAVGASFVEQIPDLARKGHIQVLAKNLIPEPRLENYQELSWFVIKADRSLILGDAGCLFEVAQKANFVSLNSKGDKLKNVFLPISSNTLVLGTSLSAPPSIDFQYLNEQIVKCSREFFICEEASQEVLSMHSFLGENAEILSKNEIAQIVKEVIEE